MATKLIENEVGYFNLEITSPILAYKKLEIHEKDAPVEIDGHSSKTDKYYTYVETNFKFANLGKEYYTACIPVFKKGTVKVRNIYVKI